MTYNYRVYHMGLYMGVSDYDGGFPQQTHGKGFLLKNDGNFGVWNGGTSTTIQGNTHIKVLANMSGWFLFIWRFWVVFLFEKPVTYEICDLRTESEDYCTPAPIFSQTHLRFMYDIFTTYSLHLPQKIQPSMDRLWIGKYTLIGDFSRKMSWSNEANSSTSVEVFIPNHPQKNTNAPNSMTPNKSSYHLPPTKSYSY